ncbi:uncharacterized protein LOC123481544 [Coregonus clupeaformis]|uniref:uncharacterized protein LOC123481544 n=1 Tax=Coregonus clupeaformis TaxID=59861 RepID=UPI001E1C67AD|nr:uncharacterized protein LOC123481544 [Coregonus clupeaformis]
MDEIASESFVMARFPKKRLLSEVHDVNSPTTDGSSDSCHPEEDVAAISTRSHSEGKEIHQRKKRHLPLSDEEGDHGYCEDDVNLPTDTDSSCNGGPPEEDVVATSTRSQSEGNEIHQRESPSPTIINAPDQPTDPQNQVDFDLRYTFDILQKKVCIQKMNKKYTWPFLNPTGVLYVAILELENMKNKPLIVISYTKDFLFEKYNFFFKRNKISIYLLNSPSQYTGHKIKDAVELDTYQITIVPDWPMENQNIPSPFENIRECIDKFYSSVNADCKQKFDTQHAWAFIESPCGGEPVFVGLFKLEDGRKKNDKGTCFIIHTEELLLEEVPKKLKNDEKLQNSNLFIYTYNSPCLLNIGHESCMNLLFKVSAELNRSYGIKTIVGYSKWYGLTGDLKTFKNTNSPSFSHFNYIISSSNYADYCDKLVILNENSKDVELPNELYDFIKLFMPNNISEVPFRLLKYNDVYRKVTNFFKTISNYHNKTNVKTDKKKEKESLDLTFSIPYFGSLNQFLRLSECLAEKFDLVKHIGNDLDRSKVKFIEWWTKTMEDQLATFLKRAIDRGPSEDNHRITVLNHISSNPVEYLQFCHLPLNTFHSLLNNYM